MTAAGSFLVAELSIRWKVAAQRQSFICHLTLSQPFRPDDRNPLHDRLSLFIRAPEPGVQRAAAASAADGAWVRADVFPRSRADRRTAPPLGWRRGHAEQAGGRPQRR